MVPFETTFVSSYKPFIGPTYYSSISTRLPEILDCSFGPVGVANPQFWGRGGRRGSGMVPFERPLVSFYRPSIVTFRLSLRVSEILPLLFSSTPLFPTPPQFSPKFLHVPLGVGGSPFGYKERRCWANCPCN